MNLVVPLPDIEAEALAFAKERLAEYRDGFQRENNRALSIFMLKEYALAHPFQLSALAADAKAGSGDAREAMEELLTAFHARGHMPPQLHSYAIDAKNPLLPRASGPSKSSTVLRNIVIVCVVDELTQKFGLRPARSRASRKPPQRPSACGILARAIADTVPEYPMKERAIEAVWENTRAFVFRMRDHFNAMVAAIPNQI